jgi:hypothetical protein
MNWVELSDEFRLGLTVAKMRGNPTTRITHECEIVDGQGMRVLSSRLSVRRARLAFSDYGGLISRAPTRHAMPPVLED